MNSEVQREGHDEDPQGLRERKKVQTREALVHAARDLFLERGFDSVTVDEIAQMANVSRRTFFRYFATKEAAAFPNRDRWLEQFHALTAQRAGEPAYQTVRRALLGMAGAFMEHRDAMIAQHRIANAATSLIAYQRDVDRVWADVIADALNMPDRIKKQLTLDTLLKRHLKRSNQQCANVLRAMSKEFGAAFDEPLFNSAVVGFLDLLIADLIRAVNPKKDSTIDTGIRQRALADHITRS